MTLRLYIVLLCALLCAGTATATAMDTDELQLPVAGRDYYRGYSWRTDEVGDSILVLHLREIVVFPPMKFKNRRQEEFYWRTVRDVKLTLPYAKLIAETLKAEREAYLKEMESSLFEQYKPILRRFSKRQAKVLIKLVQRETNQTSYEIVRAFLGTFRASFWQGFGRLFGVSLKSEFKPHSDANDAIIERVAVCVEQGTL